MGEPLSYFEYIFQDVYPGLSKFSLCLACIVVLVMISFTIYDSKLVDRVSLRLQTVISCYDIWIHCFPLWLRPYNKEGSSLCTLIAFQYFFGPLIYSFLNVCIGINLQLIFIHGISVTKKIEAAYWIGSFGLALLISIIPLALDKLGYGALEICFIKTQDEQYGKMFDFFGIQLLMIICIIYLIIIIIIVVIRLNRETGIIKDYRLFRDSSASSRAVKSVKLMGLRAILYPLVMIITQTGLVVSSSMYNLAGLQSDGVHMWELIASALLGTLNFIAFFCDPTVHSAFKKLYLRVSTRSMFRGRGEVDDNAASDSQMNIIASTNVFQEGATNSLPSDEALEAIKVEEIIKSI